MTEYTDAGDVVVEPDGSWLCEHEDGEGQPVRSVRLVDPGSYDTVACPDCDTVYVCWSDAGRRLAKPVVMAS